MILHNPATERELLRLAVAGRDGKEMERPERRSGWFGRVSAPLVVLFYTYIPAGALGAYDSRLRTEHWQTLICCILLIWSAQIGLGGLLDTITRQGYYAVFINLPIRGEQALRWARSKFFYEKWFSVLTVSFLCSFAVFDFSFLCPWKLAATTFLFFATTFATMMFLNDARLTRFHVVRIWSVVSLLLACWMVLLFFTNRKIFRTGETPEWMADAILNFTWILPPSWCMPGRLENGGAFLAIFWIGWGITRWMTWPKLAAPFFDAPQDFIEAFGDFAFDEEIEDEEKKPRATVSKINSSIKSASVEKSGKSRETFRLPAPLAMPDTGWVEHWIQRWLGKNDQNLAGAFSDLERCWTKKTNRALLSLPAWLSVTWAFKKFSPESDWKETISIWIWIASIMLPFVGLLPFTNSIPRATAIWSLGAQSFPFFSSMPVSTKDLLRISMRVTLARTTIMALIATPYAWCLLVILDPQSNPWAAVWLVPALCCFWATSRPMFVWYRLQSANRRRCGGGILVVQALVRVLSLALGIVWLVSAVVGVISGLGFFWGNPSGDDLWQLPLMAFGGLFLSGICSRAVFEIHRRQLSLRHFDWLSSE